MTITFRHGLIDKDYEAQANEQGFTLGDKADAMQELKASLYRLRLNNCVSDTEMKSITRRLNHEVVESIEPLRKEEASNVSVRA